MSTSAMIVFQDLNDICFGVSVNFDGYIEDGVGETLFRYWHNEDDIKEICVNSKKSIRCFGDIMSDIEYYDDVYSITLANRLKNMSYDKMLNEAGSFNYTYIWKESEKEWYVIRPNKEISPLKNYF